MKNRRGFTLIELLVTITIIGIIMLMILPAITNLQRENQEKKFKDYERAVLEAAKAYEDQYEEDLFGRYSEGCAYIDYKNLVDKKLLSTTKISGYECNYDTNGIIIRKVNGKSFYEVYLDCIKNGETKKLTDNSDYKTIRSSQCNVGEDKELPELEIKCDGETTPGGEYITGIDGDDGEKYYRGFEREQPVILPKLTVKVSDKNSGLEKNQYVTYEWKIYDDKEETKQIFTEKNRTTFNIKDGAGSTAEKSVRIIESLKQEEATGKAIINLSGENIVDRAGNKVDSQNITKCTYYYDNAKPTMNIAVTGERTGRSYNKETETWINEPVTIRIEVTDSTDNNIYAGIKEDSFKVNGTSLNLETISQNPKRYSYELRGQTNIEINDVYTVCDKVGNCETQRVRLRIDTEPPTCEVTGDGNWNPNGANVTITCRDTIISGVRTCAGANGNSNTDQIKSNRTYTVVDNAGNTNTCSYNVETTTQYYQVTCKEYKKCRDSSCGTEKYIKSYTVQWCNPNGCHESECEYECCLLEYPECISSTANYDTRYKECPAEGCGCKTWNANGSWKFDPCNSNSCKVDNTRPVYK